MLIFCGAGHWSSEKIDNSPIPAIIHGELLLEHAVLGFKVVDISVTTHYQNGISRRRKGPIDLLLLRNAWPGPLNGIHTLELSRSTRAARWSFTITSILLGPAVIARITDPPPLVLQRFRRAAGARGRVLGGGSRHALHREHAPDGRDMETRLVSRGDDVGRWRCGFDRTGAPPR